VAVDEPALARVAELPVAGMKLRVNDDLFHAGMSSSQYTDRKGNHEDTRSTKTDTKHCWETFT
jgi:hypothetical protein